VGVMVSIPIFTWGERRHDLHAAKLKMENVQLELNEAREMIDLQIRQNRYRYSEALKKAEMTGLSRKQAEENMRMAKENLMEGRSRLTELLEAQLQWENASSEHIDALVEMRTTLLELDKSTGEIYNYLY
jgi:outer membrane protein